MAENSAEIIVERKKHSSLVSLGIRLVKEKPLGTFGAVITLLLLLTGIFANFLAPYGYNQRVGDFLVAPGAKFWLGTDNLGRDLLSRIIYGARISMIVGLAATIFSTVGAVVVGIACGYLGGKFDLIVQRIVDSWMCLPFLPLVMLVMSLLGAGMIQIILVMGIGGWFGGSRLIRSATISIKGNMYLQAAKANGCSNMEIALRHILPNIMSVIIISFTTMVPGVILMEASLSFLGFGIPPPIPSWGGMLSGNARTFMFVAPWLALWPGLALSISVYGINMFGDALRDLLDPRLVGGVGRYNVGVRVKKGLTLKSKLSDPPKST